MTKLLHFVYKTVFFISGYISITYIILLLNTFIFSAKIPNYLILLISFYISYKITISFFQHLKERS